MMIESLENFSELANFRAIQNVVSLDLMLHEFQCQKIYQNILQQKFIDFSHTCMYS